MSKPGEDWQGETGHLDREKLARLVGDRIVTSTFFLCCPPPMLLGLVQSLRELVVAEERIHFEYFSLQAGMTMEFKQLNLVTA